MSNVSLNLLSGSLCRARSSQTSAAAQLFRALASSTCRSLAAARTIRPGFSRIIIRHASKSRSKRPPPVDKLKYNPLPNTKLQPSTTEATHTEGVVEEVTWRDYDPEGGLPLPDGELSKREIARIFGPKMHVDTGNYIICVVNWRRMSGALIDSGVDFPSSTDITSKQALQALDFLRQKFPDVDEQQRGAIWAEEESAKLRQKLVDRAVRIGLYKPDPAQEVAEEVEEEPQQGTAEGRARTGSSVLDWLRASNVAKRDLQESEAAVRISQKERSLLSKARGPLELSGGLQQQVGVKRYGTLDVVLQKPNSSASLTQTGPPEWVEYYRKQAQMIKENVIPNISQTQRLAPSALLFLAIVLACYELGSQYTPPPAEARLFPSVPPSVATLGAITAVLLGCFVASKLPPLWLAFNKYFALVPASPFTISTLGAIFRHDTVSHLATNLIGLWLVGLPLHEEVGRGWFLASFIGSGISGTMAALTYHALKKQWITYIFGASGAVSGLLGTLCVLRPQGSVYLFGYEIPFAAWAILCIVGASSVGGLVRSARTKVPDSIDHVGHVFGLLGGVVTGFVIRMQLPERKKAAMQSEPTVSVPPGKF